MNELTLFWGSRNDATFQWRATNDAADETGIKPLYQLESHEILKADLASVAEMAVNSKVTLVLSCSDVICAHLQVPNKAQKLLRKAIPYMMEDEVASSVDDLFFALANKSNDSELAVRAIDRDYFESVIATFKDAEIKLHQVIVDIDRVDVPQEGLRLVINHQQCFVVESSQKRWHCHIDDFSWLIQKQLEELSEDQDMPIAVPLEINSDIEMDEFIHQLPVGRFAVEELKIEDVNNYLLENDVESVNLLQAEFEVKKESSQLTSFLLKVASVSGFVLLSYLILQSVNIYTLSEQKQQLDQQKVTLFKQAFPRNKNTRRPEKEMRIYVKSLGSSSGGGGFLSLLNSVSDSLTDLSKIYPTNISYEHTRNELRMDVIASSLVVLDQYADKLRSSGHKVEKSSETQRGEGYSSRLTVSR